MSNKILNNFNNIIAILKDKTSEDIVREVKKYPIVKCVSRGQVGDRMLNNWKIVFGKK